VRKMTYLQAIVEAVREEMRTDSRVFVMGEDAQSGIYGDFGLDEFGPARIRNTPISEAGFVGAGIGAALTGMRPVVDATASTFLYCAMDQIVNQAAKSRYMFGGQATIPIVIRSCVLYGGAAAAHHSDRPWGLFAQCPGLKIVVPSTPYDAKGLMKSAIRDDNPVLWFEDTNLWGRRGPVGEGDYTIPIGQAEVKRQGSDLTIVALAGSVHLSLEAAEELEKEGIFAEVVDIRTVVPLDRPTIIESVRKTGWLIVIDPAPGMCGVASEVAATVAESAFSYLKGPIIRLTAPDLPVPFSPNLENLMFPTAERIVAAARTLRGHRSGGSPCLK
jgi:pyruvate/2-oxoglutarate/acetoin dehydrogenase E1 component